MILQFQCQIVELSLIGVELNFRGILLLAFEDLEVLPIPVVESVQLHDLIVENITKLCQDFSCPIPQLFLLLILFHLFVNGAIVGLTHFFFMGLGLSVGCFYVFDGLLVLLADVGLHIISLLIRVE